MDGRKRKLCLLFVGKGVYRSPRPLAAPARAELSSGLLDVWLLDAHGWAGRRQLAGHLARVAGMPENLPLPERHYDGNGWRRRDLDRPSAAHRLGLARGATESVAAQGAGMRGVAPRPRQVNQGEGTVAVALPTKARQSVTRWRRMPWWRASARAAPCRVR